ncbi:MAG: hypothetical protein IPP51_09550 [Bacteroidetes bacterium]|nr:hypothetical protein [Bacteroidota bacterium]
MAIENGETTKEEFKRVRSFYLKQAQEVITTIHESYLRDPAFKELFEKVEALSIS